MYIETEDNIYDILFNKVQICVTGKCNMNCLHCRDSHTNREIKINDVYKIIDFALSNRDEEIEIVISGGEPLLYSNLYDIMDYTKNKNIHLELTTNGYLVTQDFINKIINYDDKFSVSISLDSTNKDKHDSFRNFNGAFDKAISSIKLFVDNNIDIRIRTTIPADSLYEIEKMANLCITLGVKTLAIGTVMPVGNAATNSDLLVSKEQMKMFISEYMRIKNLYSEKLDVLTSECLKDLGETNVTDSSGDFIILEGCNAGTASFNVNQNGDITPCSMFHAPIANIYTCPSIENSFKNSDLLKTLLSRDYEGPCRNCSKQFTCGGCRQRALYYTGNYKASDPLCWFND